MLNALNVFMKYSVNLKNTLIFITLYLLFYINSKNVGNNDKLVARIRHFILFIIIIVMVNLMKAKSKIHVIYYIYVKVCLTYKDKT